MGCQLRPEFTELRFPALAGALLAAVLTALTLEVPLVAAERQLQDVVYSKAKDADQVRNSLDVYAPAKGADLPIMVWIHGGGWKRGSKELVDRKVTAFNERGFVLVSINYRFTPAVTYHEQGTDVARAIAWVHEHAAEFGGSRDKIFVMGHSAGAHLAALVSTDHRYLEAEKLSLATIQGAVLLDGAGYDVPRQIEIAALPALKELYIDAFGTDPLKQKDASPISHVAKEKQIPPFLILHIASRRDGKLQSESLAKAINEVGGSAKVYSAAGKTHGTINRELGLAGDAPTKEVFGFLEAQLKRLASKSKP